jgi:acetyl-CoA carboxylase biotin carboxyl carrier protein
MEVEQLLKLIEAVSESKLTGFKYEENGVKLNLKKEIREVQVIETSAAGTAMIQNCAEVPGAGVAVATANCQENTSEETEKFAGKAVVSPLVGTFYVAPAEDADPYVSVGDTVKKGQVLAIVEAMKLMNEIESEYDGVIEEVLVENGHAVEYGQPLFRIR